MFMTCFYLKSSLGFKAIKKFVLSMKKKWSLNLKKDQCSSQNSMSTSSFQQKLVSLCSSTFAP